MTCAFQVTGALHHASQHSLHVGHELTQNTKASRGPAGRAGSLRGSCNECRASMPYYGECVQTASTANHHGYLVPGIPDQVSATIDPELAQEWSCIFKSSCTTVFGGLAQTLCAAISPTRGTQEMRAQPAQRCSWPVRAQDAPGHRCGELISRCAQLCLCNSNHVGSADLQLTVHGWKV